MKFVRCPTCAGTGYLDTELTTDGPAAVACAHCSSYCWFDLETGQPADVEPPLFSLTEEGAFQS